MTDPATPPQTEPAPAQPKPPTRDTGDRLTKIFAVGAVVIGLLVMLVVTARPPASEGDTAATGNGAEANTLPDDVREQLRGFARLDPDDPLALGDVDAPVVMVEWSDFKCPFCGRWARETKPALQKYIDDGTLRIEWRDLPYLGEESMNAAIAGRAAAEQGRFWEFHDRLFSQESGEASLDEQALAQLAQEIGLDVEQFRSDFTDPRIKAAVEADREEAVSLGITGTPAFLVDGLPVMGAQPTEVFVNAIESAAAEAE